MPINAACMLFSCYVIGEGALLIECVQRLVRHGILVKGICTAHSPTQAFAQTAQIPWLDPTIALVDALARQPFDYLFSIVNPRILSADVLRLPLKGAINYHDGPLPAYAGVNATFWAILNQEKMHGITWHLMDTGLDTGPILKQHLVPIHDQETSFRLNLACFEAALTAFDSLLGELMAGTIQPMPQTRRGRSYFPRSQRPDTLLNWNQPADQILRLFHALNFGPHPNPFGPLRVWIQDSFLIVKKIERTAHRAVFGPGTVEGFTNDLLSIASADGVLSITSLETPTGQPIRFPALKQLHPLNPGDRLSNDNARTRLALTRITESCSIHQAYWEEKLIASSPTGLPFDQLRSRDTNGSDTTIPFLISPELNDFLTQTSPNADRFDGLVGALLLGLARLLGTNQVALGFQSETLQQIGIETHQLYADYVPLCLTLDWEATFAQVCEAVSQEKEQITRRMSYALDWATNHPVLKATPWIDSHLPILIQFGDETALAPSSHRASLTIGIPSSGSLAVRFNPGLWSAGQISTLLTCWQNLLKDALLHPHQLVKTLSLVSEAERNQQLYDWNATATAYAPTRLIHELVEEQTRQHPLAVALVCEEYRITYDQLNRRANRLARYLLAEGVGTQTTVGLAMDRSVELVVGLLAVLKAGGVYVPLDLSFPVIRLQWMLTQANVGYVLTQNHLIDQVPDTCRRITIEEPATDFVNEDDENLSVSLLPDALAYIMFTSGSMGQPKGVCIPHRGVVRLVSQPNYARLDTQTVLLGMASVAFDAATFEWWGALANGGQLILLPDRHPSLETINYLIHIHQVNTLFLTTALFNLWVDTGIESLMSVQQVLTGGEAASWQHLQQARQQLPHCLFTNVYGPTENTTFSSFYPVVTDLSGGSSVPIGRPVTQTQLYILDPFYQLLPVGMPGELLAGGDGLAQGYVQQPALTNQQFVSHFLFPGQRLYRTGDRARYLPDGTIEFLGRLDEQLKIRGHRIEPGEIEATLRQHPTVREVVVVARELVPGQTHLVAYVVSDEHQPSIDDAWRAFLQERLPTYLVPTVFVHLSALPLKPSGKVDTTNLPFPNQATRSQRHDHPWPPTQLALGQLWASLLTGFPSESTADFFASGGTSLLAIRLLSSLRAQFGVQLTLRDIFNQPTLDAMALLIENARPTLPLVERSPANANPEGPIPVSSAQKRLWILHQLYDIKGTYNVPVSLRLTGELDMVSLEQSFTQLLDRHQVLRTSLIKVQGTLLQQIRPAEPLFIPVIDLPTDSLSGDQDSLTVWINQEVGQPFSLADELLVRIRVARLGAQESVLLLVFHHSIFDGWSIGLLSHEVSKLYQAARQSTVVQLPDLPNQYADYARWQARWLRTDAYRAQLAYWTKQLAGIAPLLPLPTDVSRPLVTTFAGADFGFTLPHTIWQPLKHLAIDSGMTPLMRLMTVFTILLHEYGQTDDILVGIPITGRGRLEWQSLIGFFVNTVVIRTSLPENVTFRQLLIQVRQVILDAMAHSDVPFNQLVEVLNPPRHLGFAPLVQVMMDVEEPTTHPWSLPDLTVQPLIVPQQTAKFDLHLSFRETTAGLIGTLNYSTDLFLPGTIQQLASRFEQLAGWLLTQPDRPIRQFSLSLIRPQTPAVPLPTITRPGPIPTEPQLATMLIRLKAVWCQVLGIDTIEPDQDFFRLGGHSLLAIQLVEAVHRAVGWSVPVSTVFAYPTLRTMAAYLLTIEQAEVWQSLVAIQPKGNRTPFYCVHPVHGDVNYLYKLTPYLPSDQPVYGFQAVGLNGIDAPLSTIEAMARHYVNLLLKQQPTGPYQLGGFSLGGVIAYEMANQLTWSGKKVALLVLFDAYPLTPNQWNRQDLPLLTVLRSYWAFALSKGMAKSPLKWARGIRQKAPSATRYLSRLVRDRLLWRIAPPMTESKAIAEAGTVQDRLQAIHLQAYNAYRFPTYSGNVVFFRAVNRPGPTQYLRKYDGDWGKYVAGGVDVFNVPGQHDELFMSVAHTRFMAETLAGYLAPPPKAR